MRQDETIICEIQRHPIGLIAIYASFGALMLLVLVGILMAPNVLTTFDKGSVNRIGLALVIVAATFSSLFAWIATIVYNGNRWIITDDSLTQVNQLSLFDKQSSQLSLGNLEDVTSEKNGILPHIFNYGMLKVETAGERSKFVFPYCPDPDSYAQKSWLPERILSKAACTATSSVYTALRVAMSRFVRVATSRCPDKGNSSMTRRRRRSRVQAASRHIRPSPVNQPECDLLERVCSGFAKECLYAHTVIFAA